MFKLTEKGENLAQNVTAKRSTEASICSFMYSIGKPVEVEEIMDETRMSDEKTALTLRRMVNGGLVEEI